MRILFLIILFIPKAYSFDPTRLKADMDLIKAEFLPIEKTDNNTIPTKRLSRSIAPIEKTEIEDLEGKYFDTVSNRLAAPKLVPSKKKFKRVR